MNRSNLERWVQATEKDLRTLEGEVKVLRNVQVFTGWVCGLLLTANLMLMGFLLHKVFLR